MYIHSTKVSISKMYSRAHTIASVSLIYLTKSAKIIAIDSFTEIDSYQVFEVF